MKSLRKHLIALPIFLLLLSAGGCFDFGSKPTEGEEGGVPSYHVERGVDKFGARRDSVRITGKPNEDVYGENVLEDVKKILREEDARAEEALRQKRKRDPLKIPERPSEEVLRSRTKKETLTQRRARFMKLIQTPDASCFWELHAALLDPRDLLSALAGKALATAGGLEAERALEKALGDARPGIRKVALGGLVSLRSPVAAKYCRELLQKDPRADVRTVAVTGLGMLRDEVSLPLLRRALKDSGFDVRMYAAWALGRLYDANGIRVLQGYALSGDTTIAPKGIRLLGSLKNSDTVPVLYQCLFARRDPIWRAAAGVLATFPQKQLTRGLEKFPSATRKKAQLQFAMLRGLTGDAPIPPETYVLALQGRASEKILAIRCFGATGYLASIPTLILAREDADESVWKSAEKALVTITKRNSLKLPSGKYASWRRWWLEQHYILSATEAEAVLLLPGGEKQRVKVGTRLQPDAVVVRILAGRGLRGRIGARVKVRSDGGEVILYSKPGE